VKKGDKRQPAELRCVGDEEVVKFQVRGVGSLRAGWKKKSKDGQDHGIIEGIEDDLAPVDELGLVRRDKVAKSHTVPLRVKHDTPGVYTVSLTTITDSMHNTYTPSGHSAEKVFNVVARPQARFECTSPVQLLKDKTASLPFTVDALGGLPADIAVTYGYRLEDGSSGTKKLKVSKKQESIMVSEPGTYTLMEISGQCAGSIMEPATCVVTMVPPPSVEMSVTTLHEWYVLLYGVANKQCNGCRRYSGFRLYRNTTIRCRIYGATERSASGYKETAVRWDAWGNRTASGA
jgi:nucleoporin POM152